MENITMSNEQSIEYLLKVVNEIKEENKQLIKKVNELEEKNETLSSEIIDLQNEVDTIESEDTISKKEMCEYVEEKINDISPLKEGWEAVYSDKHQRMGYFYDNRRMLNEPPPTYLYFDREEHTKHKVICVNSNE